MFSIFEDDEFEMPYRRFGRPPVSSGGGVSFTITSTLAPYSSPPKKTQEKRSRLEALDRSAKVLGLAGEVGDIFPAARPYTSLFQGVTIGLIVVDPLDRLER